MDKAKLTATFLEALKEYDVSPNVTVDAGNLTDITFEQLALDSLDLLQLAMDIETTLDIEIEVEDIPRDATLDEFLEFLLKLPKTVP